MSRHRPEAGADAEPVDPRDESCDYCGRQVFDRYFRVLKIAGSTSWLCDTCYERQQERFASMVR